MGNVVKHIYTEYDAELCSLRQQISSMGELVGDHLHGAVAALAARDADLARKIIDADRAVNHMELAIDEQCIRMLALRQPAATDLRFIAAALKMVTDLERIGDLSVDMARRDVRRGDVAVELTAKEFDLLAYLARNAGRVLSRSQIMDHVWGYDAEPASNVVDIYVHYLRDKIDRDSPQPLIRTVRGVGYTIKE